MTSVYYIDGQFIRADEAQIPVNDLAVLRGYGVFDFMRTYGGKPFHLEAHVERLFRSAEQIMLDMPWTPQEVIQIVLETVARNDHAEYNVRIIVTGGDLADFITPLDKPRLIVLVTPAAPPPDRQYSDGVKIITVREDRYLPGAKTINYIPAIRALKQARAQSAVEAIYTDAEGRALEGTTTNIFAFFGDTLVTPGNGVLEGITRGVVIEVASDLFTVDIHDLPLEAVYRADEVFITASNKEVMPVIQVNDKIIGSGTPGQRTQRVMALFEAVTKATIGI